MKEKQRSREDWISRSAVIQPSQKEVQMLGRGPRSRLNAPEILKERQSHYCYVTNPVNQVRCPRSYGSHLYTGQK